MKMSWHLIKSLIACSAVRSLFLHRRDQVQCHGSIKLECDVSLLIVVGY